MSGNLPDDWIAVNSYITPTFKKGIIDHLHSTIDQSLSQQYVLKFWSTLAVYHHIMEHVLQYQMIRM